MTVQEGPGGLKTSVISRADVAAGADTTEKKLFPSKGSAVNRVGKKGYQ